MKARKLTIEFAATKSQNFQSVRMGTSIEIDLEDGDVWRDVIRKVRPALSQVVSREATYALDDLLYGPVSPEQNRLEATA